MMETKVADLKSMETQTYALSSILVLIQTCNYDYGAFYLKLYALANVTLDGSSPFDMDSPACLAYIKLVELSLKSTNLSHVLICAFIKVRARL